MNSPLDSSLAVLNLEGKELARNEDANGLDSLIVFRPPEAAIICCNCAIFATRAGRILNTESMPARSPISIPFSRSADRRGQSVEVELQGHNLASLTITNKIDQTRSSALQEIRAQGTNLLSNPRAFEIGEPARVH